LSPRSIVSLISGVRYNGKTLVRACHTHKHPGRQETCITVASSHHDDYAHVFGEKSHIAGIPTCSKCTTVGVRLRSTLRNRPHEFVAVALQEVEEVFGRPEPTAAAALVSLEEKRKVEMRRRQTSHYHSVRARLDALTEISRSYEGSPDPPGPKGILNSEAKFEELADVMYFWALAEAYLQHPQMQQDMRKSLEREGSGAMAEGEDGLELRSRVQLLDGPFYEGQYLIGSVNFVRSATPAGSSNTEDEQASPSGTLYWGGQESGWEEKKVPMPLLDTLFGSSTGRMMLAIEGDVPTSIKRRGALRSYDMYTKWGYFERRMSLRHREQRSQSTLLTLGLNQGARSNPDPPSAAPWKFFENVPDELSSLRTTEAIAVAERHLRALFGDGEECLTTLQAWQQMTYEAKRFGRALFDAEDMVLQSCCNLMEA